MKSFNEVLGRQKNMMNEGYIKRSGINSNTNINPIRRVTTGSGVRIIQKMDHISDGNPEFGSGDLNDIDINEEYNSAFRAKSIGNMAKQNMSCITNIRNVEL